VSFLALQSTNIITGMHIAGHGKRMPKNTYFAALIQWRVEHGANLSDARESARESFSWVKKSHYYGHGVHSIVGVNDKFCKFSRVKPLSWPN
jgi:hypothetical protein